MSSHKLHSSRRRALRALSAGALAAGLGPFGPARAQGKIIVGVIYVGPKEDYGYN